MATSVIVVTGRKTQGTSYLDWTLYGSAQQVLIKIFCHRNFDHKLFLITPKIMSCFPMKQPPHYVAGIPEMLQENNCYHLDTTVQLDLLLILLRNRHS